MCAIAEKEDAMTAAKANLVLPSRTPAYVDRATGAAELRISPETWDHWVDIGILPPAAPGFPTSTPRWRWADVDRKLAGLPTTTNDVDKAIEAAGRWRGATKIRKRVPA
jgi:hypothetical protein